LQPLHVSLTKHLRFSARLSALQQAVNDQEGLSQVEFLQGTVHESDSNGEVEGLAGEGNASEGQSLENSPGDDSGLADNAEFSKDEEHDEGEEYEDEEPQEDLEQKEEKHGNQHDEDEYQLEDHGEAQQGLSRDEKELAPILAEHNPTEAGDGGEFTALAEDEYELFDFGDETQAPENVLTRSTTLEGDELLEPGQDANDAESGSNGSNASVEGNKATSIQVNDAVDDVSVAPKDHKHDSQVVSDKGSMASDNSGSQQEPFDLTVAPGDNDGDGGFEEDWDLEDNPDFQEHGTATLGDAQDGADHWDDGENELVKDDSHLAAFQDDLSNSAHPHTTSSEHVIDGNALIYDDEYFDQGDDQEDDAWDQTFNDESNKEASEPSSENFAEAGITEQDDNNCSVHSVQHSQQEARPTTNPVCVCGAVEQTINAPVSLPSFDIFKKKRSVSSQSTGFQSAPSLPNNPRKRSFDEAAVTGASHQGSSKRFYISDAWRMF
jgi:hypothetical protein